MLRKFFCIISILNLSTCSVKNAVHEQKGPDGVTLVGSLFQDSLFEGKVKYFDSLHTYIGYSTFRFGEKKGVEVKYYKSGKISDSSFYRHDMQNGMAYKFDEKGHLLYKTYYLNDRPFGHMFEYDSIGNITHYYFINFEGKIIFESKKEDTSVFRKGEPIQANVYASADGNNTNDYLFLYLFCFPYNKCHYEFGILDSNKKIISSEKIISKNCYYEKELIKLPNGEKYAVILHTYNPYLNKDDLTIRIIE